MIKTLGPAQQHPTNRSFADFQNYWATNHGPLFSNTKRLRRYVQHLTLPEAYGGNPAPTFDGCSMFWYDDLASAAIDQNDAEQVELRRAVIADDAQLFDRIVSWPTHHKHASVSAEERVILEGETAPEMVKLLVIVAKMPGLDLLEFSDHWSGAHAELESRLPGLRRYVQNSAIPAAYAAGRQTHDGWAELWFDDLASLQAAAKSPEWRALQEDAETLFGPKVDIGIARERIQKDLDWTYRDWGVNGMSEDDVRQQLKDNRYSALANDASAPAKIKAAAASQTLAVFTDQHIVTFDGSAIDVRPDR